MASLASIAVKNPLFREIGFEALKNSFDDPEANNNDDNNGSHKDHAVLDVTPEELAQIQKWNKVLRVKMLIISALVMVTAYYNIASTSGTLASTFLALYLLFFSCMLCCFEIAYKTISIYLVQNFGFLYTAAGKCVFLLFVGIVCYELSVMGKVMFGLLVLYGIIYSYVSFKHPQFSQYLRLMHFYNKVKAGRKSVIAA